MDKNSESFCLVLGASGSIVQLKSQDGICKLGCLRCNIRIHPGMQNQLSVFISVDRDTNHSEFFIAMY